MPAYFYWGDDDYSLQQAVNALRAKTLDPAWESFNYDLIPADATNAPIQALNQAMTPLSVWASGSFGCRIHPWASGVLKICWLNWNVLCQICRIQRFYC
jgi:hypothetical protein